MNKFVFIGICIASINCLTGCISYETKDTKYLLSPIYVSIKSKEVDELDKIKRELKYLRYKVNKSSIDENTLNKSNKSQTINIINK